MSYSDLLAVIGVGIAIWALLPEERKLLWGSFITKWQWRGLFGLLIIIHLVIASDWLHNMWGWFNIFYLESGGIPSDTIAYVLLLLLFFIFVYLLFFTYPAKNSLGRLGRGYKQLLDTGKIDVLNGYLNKYHYGHISCEIVERKESGLLRFEEVTLKRPSFENKKYKTELSSKVFLRLLQHRKFIDAQSVSQPEVFATAFSKLYNPQCLPKQIVKDYCKVIISQLDPSASELLKEMIGRPYHDSMESMVHGSSYMLLPLIENGENANFYSLWQPFAKAALQDLRRSDELKRLLESDYHADDTEILDFNTLTVSIRFIAALYSLKLRSQARGHMWIHYYDLFLKEMIDVCDLKAFNKDFDTYVVQLIEEMRSILIAFVQEAADHDQTGATSDVVKVYCKCIAVLASKAIDRPKVEDAIRVWFDRLYKTWFEYYDKVEGGGTRRNGPFGSALRTKWKDTISSEVKFLDPDALIVYRFNANQAWLKYDLIGDDLTTESEEVLELMEAISGTLGLSKRAY